MTYDEGDLLPTPGAASRDGGSSMETLSSVPRPTSGVWRHASAATLILSGAISALPRKSAVCMTVRQLGPDFGLGMLRAEGVHVPAGDQYAWPSRITQGADDQASAIRMQEEFNYDVLTGQVTNPSYSRHGRDWLTGVA